MAVGLIFFAAISLVSVYPVENLFVSFDSPQKAFNYYTFGEIEKTVDGEESCMIVYRNRNNTYQELIMQKTEKGYKLPSEILSKTVEKKQQRENNMKIIHAVGTHDYYISGYTATKDENIKIRSSDDRELECISVNTETSDYKIILFYGVTDSYSGNYNVYMNDNALF